jgi:regulator of PEP synthase PpsR (kinase-PPPase family)
MTINRSLSVAVVSDATGATAEAVVTSALVQFGGAPAIIRRFPFTRSVEDVERIVASLPEDEGIVVFTFVSTELAQAMVAGGRTRGLMVIDLLSGLMASFADVLGSNPSRTAGAYRGQSEDLFKVTDAIHFTLQHDDGQCLDTVSGADLVILGVSRTGKTPTSIYLSCRKLKVANVPIVAGFPLPSEVVRAPAPKVGFVMDLERLVRLRGERVGRSRERSIPGYADRSSIVVEREHCESVYRSIAGLHTVDVTDRSVEETSDWITHNVL